MVSNLKYWFKQIWFVINIKYHSSCQMQTCEDKNSSLPEVHVPVSKKKPIDNRKKPKCIIILLTCVL